MRVFVTGGEGFVGKHLLPKLINKYKVKASIRPQKTPTFISKDIEWISMDLGEEHSFEDIFSDVDTVIHLAHAVSYRDFPLCAPSIFDVNVDATWRMVHGAISAGVKQFVFASTGSLYVGAKPPHIETMGLFPDLFFAASKLAAEQLLWPYAKNMVCSSLRIFGPYGPYQENRLVSNLIKSVQNRQPIKIQGNEGLTMPFTYIDDLVACIMASIEQKWIGPINVSSDSIVNLKNLALLIGQLVRIDPIFEFCENEAPIVLLPDTDKLKKLMGSYEFMPIDIGLKKMIG